MHTRGSMRLPAATHDYRAASWYFVTICTAGRRKLFAEVHHGGLVLTSSGAIVSEEWRAAPHVRPNVTLDAFVVMPDHLHAIVGLSRLRRTTTSELRWPHGPEPGSLGALIKQFKSRVTKRILALGIAGPVWQRGYHERVIRRDGEHLKACRRYVENNPATYLLAHAAVEPHHM